jgi:hypothetical protein
MPAALQCLGCHEKIGTGQYVQVPGTDHHFHPACFKCETCGEAFASGSFMPKDGKYYCQKDYEDKFAEKCAKCEKPLTGKTIVAFNKHWHTECLTCSACNGPLSSKFYQRDSGPCCETCAHGMAPKCKKCDKVIQGQSVSAGGDNYHPDCFSCSKCQGSLGGESFVPHEGGLYHAKCYQSLFGKTCHVCGGFIEGTYFENKGQFVHEKCMEKYKKLQE